MKRAFLTLALALSLGTVAVAAPIRGETTYAPYKKIVLKAETVAAGTSYLWDFSSEEVEKEEVGGTVYVWAPPGKYRVTLTAINFDKKSVERASFSFTVTGKKPDVDPVDPVDPPPPSGLVKNPRVLIVEESAERTKLPAETIAVILGRPFRDFLNSVAPLDPDGKTKTWRIWDKDVDASNPAVAEYKKLLDRKRTALPWIVIADGKTGAVGFEGPLPKDTASAIALVKKTVAPASARRENGKKGGR